MPEAPPEVKPVFVILMDAKGDWQSQSKLPPAMTVFILQTVITQLVTKTFTAVEDSAIIAPGPGDVSGLARRINGR